MKPRPPSAKSPLFVESIDDFGLNRTFTHNYPANPTFTRLRVQMVEKGGSSPGHDRNSKMSTKQSILLLLFSKLKKLLLSYECI